MRLCILFSNIFVSLIKVLSKKQFNNFAATTLFIRGKLSDEVTAITNKILNDFYFNHFFKI